MPLTNARLVEPAGLYHRTVDLASLARLMRRTFQLEDARAFERLPLDARGLIGNGCTAALVAADGAVDWLCMPHFDSPSVFARVLDAKRGGSMAVRPARPGFESMQAYDPDTNVLETLLSQPGGGALRVVDYMPWSNDPRAAIHELHRRVDSPDGVLEAEIVFDPRFDYGRDVPTIELVENGAMAIGAGGERLSLSVSRRLDWTRRPEGGVRAVTKVGSAHLWCVIAWGAESVDATALYRPYEHLRVTRRRWREWAGQLTYDGPWRHLVLRAALALKLLIFAPTGAMVAAPTASLPEWPGGPRNWDYRYTWARDAAMAIRSANLIGYGTEARDFYHFIRDAVDAKAGLQLMYTVRGGHVPEEQTLAHLAGALGSAPVRIGNGAREQVQLDTYGAIVDAAHLYERFGGVLEREALRKVGAIIEEARRRWREPDHGMWEPRHGTRHNVHSKLMNWLAMDRGAQLARAFAQDEAAERWSAAASEIREDVCARAMDRTQAHFTSVYGEERPDASLLLLPIHGFLPESDPRMAATVDWVRRELGDGPFVYRYRDEDGLAGPEGAFTLCGFWLAEALALLGRLDEARDVFAAHADSANHLGLLAEEIVPGDRTQLGNFPQAFSHLGLVNAALRIDRALRLQDEGSTVAPHLVGPASRRRW